MEHGMLDSGMDGSNGGNGSATSAENIWELKGGIHSLYAFGMALKATVEHFPEPFAEVDGLTAVQNVLKLLSLAIDAEKAMYAVATANTVEEILGMGPGDSK